MPAKQGRLIALTKHIGAYVHDIPLVWKAYLREKSKGMEQKKAESAAMRTVYPDDNNIGVRLNTWKKHKFWPEAATAEIRESLAILSASLSEGIEQGEAESEAVKTLLKDYPHASEALEIWKRCGVWSQPGRAHEEYREEPSNFSDRPGDSEAASRMTKGRRTQESPRPSRDIPGTSQTASGQSKANIMAELRALLAEIPVEERKWFGKATGKASEDDKFLQIGAKLPPDLVVEFKSLPGRYAHHLERALKLYLMILRSAER